MDIAGLELSLGLSVLLRPLCWSRQWQERPTYSGIVSSRHGAVLRKIRLEAGRFVGEEGGNGRDCGRRFGVLLAGNSSGRLIDDAMHCSPGWSSRQALTRVAPRCLAHQVGGWGFGARTLHRRCSRQGPLQSPSLPNPCRALFPAASRCCSPANSSPLPTSPSDFRPRRGHQTARIPATLLSA